MKKSLTLFTLFFLFQFGIAQDSVIPEVQKFEPIDVFQLEFVSDPQISPDGQHIIYRRNFKDIMTDRNLSNLWICKFDGSDNHPLTTGNQNDRSPRWSPDGKRLLYISNKDGSSQIYLRWLDNGAEAKLTNLQTSPAGITWSPDGKWIGMTIFVPEAPKSLVQMPKAPAGAKWADPAKYIDDMYYRGDGQGYLKPGSRQIFVMSVDGGTSRQITSGKNGGMSSYSWTKDSKSIIFGGNRHEDWEFQTNNSEIFKISVNGGDPIQLTNRVGPDSSPRVSPDGKTIAYTGFDDKYQGFQITKLYVMNLDGSGSKCLTPDLDRNVSDIKWSHDGSGVLFSILKQRKRKNWFC